MATQATHAWNVRTERHSELAWGRLAVVTVLMLALAAATVVYAATAVEQGSDPERTIIGGWLLAVLGLGAVLATQVVTHTPSDDATGPDALGWRAQLLRPAVALLSAGVALIHIAVIQEHLQEDVLFGAFFIALSVFQLAWAMAVLVRPTRLLLWAGIVVNLGTIAVWVVSRTVGLPFGPEAGEVGVAGLGDGLATAFEALIMVGALMLLVRRKPSGHLRVATATTAIVLMTVVIAAFTAIGLISSVGGTNLIPPAG
jgi:hypothetical protein